MTPAAMLTRLTRCRWLPAALLALPAALGFVSCDSTNGAEPSIPSAVVNEVISQVSKGKSSSHGSYGHGYQKKRRESFLSDLFG